MNCCLPLLAPVPGREGCEAAVLTVPGYLGAGAQASLSLPFLQGCCVQPGGGEQQPSSGLSCSIPRFHHPFFSSRNSPVSPPPAPRRSWPGCAALASAVVTRPWGSAELGDIPAAPSRSLRWLLLQAGRREGSGGSDSSELRSRCQIYS